MTTGTLIWVKRTPWRYRLAAVVGSIVIIGVLLSIHEYSFDGFVRRHATDAHDPSTSGSLSAEVLNEHTTLAASHEYPGQYPDDSYQDYKDDDDIGNYDEPNSDDYYGRDDIDGDVADARNHDDDDDDDADDYHPPNETRNDNDMTFGVHNDNNNDDNDELRNDEEDNKKKKNNNNNNNLASVGNDDLPESFEGSPEIWAFQGADPMLDDTGRTNADVHISIRVNQSDDGVEAGANLAHVLLIVLIAVNVITMVVLSVALIKGL